MTGGHLTRYLRHMRRVIDPARNGGLPDAELLQRFVSNGDEAAFEVLVWRHGPMVLGVCRRVLRHEQDSEDAFQATYLTLARKAGSIGKREALASWLYKVAYRVALTARSRMRRCLPLREELLPATDRGDELDWRDLRPVLDEEVSRLPARYRGAFVLCYLEGRTNAEAARQLGCPEGTVLSRLAWARGRLRSRLARRGITLAGGMVAALAAETASGQVPPLWMGRTVEAAMRFAAWHAAVGADSARAAALAEGVVRAMWMTKVKVVATILFMAGVTGGATLLVHGASATEPQGTAQVPAAQVVETGLAVLAKAEEEANEEESVSVKDMQPVVVKTQPQAGDTQVDAATTTEIRVTFSKDMADRSWSWSQISNESFPKTTGKAHYDRDKRTCILPVKLQPGKTYVLYLNPPKFQGFRDTDGKPAVFYPLVFETKR